MATHLADASQITQLLQRWQRGDRAALDTLMPLVYDELRRLARSRLRREPADNSVHATTLVHEVYLRLVNERAMNWQSRAHFLGVASQLMRFILVDHCRRKYNDKRGGRLPRVPLDEATVVSCEAAPRLLALDQALKVCPLSDENVVKIVPLLPLPFPESTSMTCPLPSENEFASGQCQVAPANGLGPGDDHVRPLSVDVVKWTPPPLSGSSMSRVPPIFVMGYVAVLCHPLNRFRMARLQEMLVTPATCEGP